MAAAAIIDSDTYLFLLFDSSDLGQIWGDPVFVKTSICVQASHEVGLGQFRRFRELSIAGWRANFDPTALLFRRVEFTSTSTLLIIHCAGHENGSLIHDVRYPDDHACRPVTCTFFCYDSFQCGAIFSHGCFLFPDAFALIAV
jgi:hypothetical protein